MSYIESLNRCTSCWNAIWKARTCIWVFFLQIIQFVLGCYFHCLCM